MKLGLKKIFLFEEEWNDYLKENTNIKLDKDICRDVIVQLNEYFNKKRKNFNLSLSIEGTEFRKKRFGRL